MGVWSVIEGPATTLALGAVLLFAAFVLLREYGRVFRSDAKATMSVEVLIAALSGSGGPGYLAAFLLAAAVLCVVLALYTLGINILSYLGSSVVT